MMTVRTSCRDCDSHRLVKFLDLGAQPAANRLVKKEILSTPEPVYPLEVYVCEDCNAAQLIHIVDKHDLFSEDYVYYTNAVPKISKYWQSYAQYVADKFIARPDQFIVEIGSNDGVLLNFFKELGHSVLGIDPATNITPVAKSLGVPTITDFFSSAVAGQIALQQGKADLVLANNVFAHIDDHQDFCKGVQHLLKPEGVLVIEAPYLVDMFERVAYDTVYHEHLEFLSVRPLQKLFDRFGLEIFDIYLSPAFGQSLRLSIGKKGLRPVTRTVNEFVQKELGLGLDKVESYHQLAARVAASKQQLVTLLRKLRQEGRTIVGYGAAARSSTIMNYCGIGSELLTCILDDFPSKQGKYSPGMHVPILNRTEAGEFPTDYYLLFAWNYLNQVLDQEQEFRARGGKFIIPVGDTIEVL
jgi:SAM-dependent methyltransferase